MGWVKLDDGFFRHPKAIAAGRDGRMLFIAALCYCGSGLTDGFVPAGALALLAAETGVSKPKDAAAALIDAGLWEPCSGGFRVHDYLDYNTSSGKVQHERAAARERMQRNRSPEVRPNISRSSPEVRQPEEKRRETEGSFEPNGSSEPSEGASAPAKPKPESKPKATRLADGWEPSEAFQRWATAEQFAPAEVAAELAKFRDHHRQKGTLGQDWDAGFRNWMRRSREMGAVKLNGNGKPPLPPILRPDNVPDDGGLAAFRAAGQSRKVG